MAASTAAREAQLQDSEIVYYLLGAVKVNKGTLVSVQTNGYLYPARSGTATDIFVGVAYEGFDNSAGAAGAAGIRVIKEGSFVFGATSPVQANVGTAFYAADDQTVTTTATSNQLVGYAVGVVDSSDIRIRINRAVQ